MWSDDYVALEMAIKGKLSAKQIYYITVSRLS